MSSDSSTVPARTVPKRTAVEVTAASANFNGVLAFGISPPRRTSSRLTSELTGGKRNGAPQARTTFDVRVEQPVSPHIRSPLSAISVALLRTGPTRDRQPKLAPDS